MREPTDEEQWLAERFERHRARLESIAYRVLGSLAEAEDAVQETWIRMRRANGGAAVDASRSAMANGLKTPDKLGSPRPPTPLPRTCEGGPGGSSA